MIKVVGCCPDHILELPLDGDHGRVSLLEDVACDAQFFSQAFTLLIDEQPAACFGVWMHWNKVGRVWTFISPHAKEYPVALNKAAKVCLAEVIAKCDMKRIEATVDARDETAIRWAERFGFVREGTMRNYGESGEGDFHLYARIFE